MLIAVAGEIGVRGGKKENRSKRQKAGLRADHKEVVDCYTEFGFYSEIREAQLQSCE